MDAHVKVSGAWKTLTGIHTRVSGTWKAVNAGYIKVSGVWKQFYAAVAYALSGETGIIGAETQPATSYAGVRINADGTVDKREDGTYTQIDSATDYVIPNGAVTGSERFRCTDNNANLDAGSSATGTWLAAPCEWFISNAAAPIKNLDIDIEISILGDTTTDDTGNFTGQCNSEP